MISRLDLRGLKCPLPVLKTRQALHTMGADEPLEVSTSDPLAGVDIPVLAAELGFGLTRRDGPDGTLIFTLKKEAGNGTTSSERFNLSL